jgi:4-methyl-5(b-hydroxyethyl)-thiazole monophosphate biosynthesis
MKTALLLVATGFEEIEAVTICDVLRRGEINVTMAGLGGTAIQGAHNITIQTDTTLGAVADDLFDAIILPGGMAGTENLLASEETTFLLQSHAKAGKLVSAICAAPWVLADAKVLGNKKATIYPSLEGKIGGSAEVESVVQDGNIITSKGPATAMAFALALVQELMGEAKKKEAAQGLLYRL